MLQFSIRAWLTLVVLVAMPLAHYGADIRAWCQRPKAQEQERLRGAWEELVQGDMEETRTPCYVVDPIVRRVKVKPVPTSVP